MPQSKKKGHILVVEHNEITRKLIVGILHNKGYETYEAANGDEALLFLAKEPLLAIIDVDNEQSTSLGFIHKLRMEHSKLPVVIVSENADKKAVRAKVGMPRVSVLEKPVVPDRLLGDIEDHLVKGVQRKIATEAKEHEKQADSFEHADPKTRSRQEDFMRRAIDLSQQKMHENCGGPFGAVIVKNGAVIAEGWNEVTSKNDPTAHAEVMAIRKAAGHIGDYKLEGCEIYTSCEPCPMCLAAIYWARIDRIYYANTREDAESIGFDDNFIFREFTLPENRRTMPSRMLLREEAKVVFEEWVKKPDKTVY